MTLNPVWRIGSLDLTATPFLVAFGTDYGAPENATDILRSLLTDGDLEVTSRRGNRTVTLPVLVEGADLGALAQAEADLWAEVDKAQNELYCDPGDGLAAPFVLDVFRGSMVLNRSDEYEQAGYRSYTLTFKALPWVRSATETTVAALSAPPGSPTTTNVDNGSSATNWTATWLQAGAVPGGFGSGSASVSSSGGALQAATTSYTGGISLTMKRTASITGLGTLPYLSVDWKATTSPPVSAVSMTGDAGAVVLDKISEGPSPTAGYTRSYFQVPSGTTSLSSIEFTAARPAGWVTANPLTVFIDNIDKTDTVPAASGKQQLRSIDIDGSAPTIGSIAVEHATSALGDDVLVYTFAAHDGAALVYSPHLRGSGYRVSGPTQNTDSTAVSGFNVNIDTVETFDIPYSALPSGVYLPVVRMKSSTAAPSVTTTTSARVNSTTVSAVTSTATTVALGGSVYKTVRLPMVTLPPMGATASSSTMVRFTIVATVPASYDIFVDEVWLFNAEIGRLSQFDLGTASPSAGGTSNRLWIDSPSLENDGLGQVWRGYASDRSDAYSAFPVMDAEDVHEFAPPSVKVFTVTPNIAAPDVSFRYFPRWHTHPAA